MLITVIKVTEGGVEKDLEKDDLENLTEYKVRVKAVANETVPVQGELLIDNRRIYFEKPNKSINSSRGYSGNIAI